MRPRLEFVADDLKFSVVISAVAGNECVSVGVAGSEGINGGERADQFIHEDGRGELARVQVDVGAGDYRSLRNFCDLLRGEFTVPESEFVEAAGQRCKQV